MTAMKWITRIWTRNQNQVSLFYTLLISFISIIVLLLSIHAWSYSFFRNRIKDEIILNSAMNLNTTVANYEKHIRLIRSYMVGYLFGTDTEILKNGNPLSHYETVVKAQYELQHALNNSLLYLDNIIYYYKDSGFIIEKDGTRDAATMFGKFYVQPAYNTDFWNKELEGTDSFKIYPSAPFTSETAFERKSLGTLMPILVKGSFEHNFAFIVLMKSRALYDAFYQPQVESHLMILDGSQLIFASESGIELPPSLMTKNGDGYERIGGAYYFYKTSAETGLTYIESVSDKGLADQLRHLNAIMAVLLFLSLLISLAVSTFIAKRFHNPLASLLLSIENYRVGLPLLGKSRIREFNLLHNDLHSKNTMLQQFAYMTRLKNIHGKGAQLLNSADVNRPFKLILFQIDFKAQPLAEFANVPHRAFNTYRELIDVHFAKLYSESLTFQMEKDQILSILFIEKEDEDRHAADFDALLRILETDSVFCNFTIAPSPIHAHSSDFAEAYQDALELIRQRKLGEDVQVITEWQPQPALMIPAPSEESELIANLHAGSDSVTIPLVDKLLDQLAKADAAAWQFQDFAQDVVNKTIKMMYAQNISIQAFSDKGSPYDHLKACYTLEQYKAFFHWFLARSGEAIQDKKSETDVMTKFVMEYVESNFGEDLSLDAISAKLGITGPYLSSYFKEKTGTNFSDYIFTVRMNKAMDMLRDTDLKIQEIASLIGYFTAASFNRVFKKHTGITPSEFRRLHSRH
ncbi:helix-turn-helix domain-containing protein [Paenibacillus sp. LMG 31460]|uniref:Helix-turn-helix domain-containing protein n=2 Tax=Paenibacillus germinis TaxID=2654979 RepID=A0ABX1Z8C1_9BACL|nr:helix-turn-helix domain-containing protein [Paenibacillus germinis]